ncbi:DEAD/DEAH box helicase family protein [Oerskovia sp. M15]
MILGKFCHTETKTSRDPISGEQTTTRTLLFPRYHQWEAVTKMVDHARTHGPGQRYLIQHSAGSGKTNSIAWTAHRLARLFDENDRKVFDTVIVVTDRTVLDDQLQVAVRQIDAADTGVKRGEGSSPRSMRSRRAGPGRSPVPWRRADRRQADRGRHAPDVPVRDGSYRCEQGAGRQDVRRHRR